MRAEKEFKNWIESEKFITAEGGLGVAYITGFNRAIALMEQFLKEKHHETEHTTQS